MKRNPLQLPKHIEYICAQLENAGFAAYAVGGCVRDLLQGKYPHDYDITTAAHPEDVKKIFPRTADTGLVHGTVTVILPEGAAEVTTFRCDGVYTDSRRPDGVTFVTTVEEDLARRDFTVNAMAYSPVRGLTDPFSGQADLERKLLRTVGKPRQRFGEDALRILRLHRFSAQLSFSIEGETAKAANALVGTLQGISKERIYAEIEKLICFGDAHHLQSASVVLREVLRDANLSEDNLRKTAACASMAGKWVHLCGAFAADTLRSLHASRKCILSAEELSAYKRGEHIITDVAALRHTSPEDFFAFLNDKEAQKIWKSAKINGIPRCLAELAISGKEIEQIGFSDREIGEVLQNLFVYAIRNPANNKEKNLREVAAWMYRQKRLQKE